MCVHACRWTLLGGYYDAGDNVKYGLPMAFTVTTLAWGVPFFISQNLKLQMSWIIFTMPLVGVSIIFSKLVLDTKDYTWRYKPKQTMEHS